MIEDMAFQAEDDQEVDQKKTPGEIGPGDSMVYRVRDSIEFGQPAPAPQRAAATISFNAQASQISVATTQMNLEESSTDTVVYGLN